MAFPSNSAPILSYMPSTEDHSPSSPMEHSTISSSSLPRWIAILDSRDEGEDFHLISIRRHSADHSHALNEVEFDWEADLDREGRHVKYPDCCDPHILPCPTRQIFG